MYYGILSSIPVPFKGPTPSVIKIIKKGFLRICRKSVTFCFSIFFHKHFSAIRTRCETLESGDLSTFDQIFWLYSSKSRKNIFWKSQKLLKMWFFRFLLYNLIVYWHDIKHKLHAIVALHATKVIKMILEVMQPTYNPILVRILNKFWFCAKRLI